MTAVAVVADGAAASVSRGRYTAHSHTAARPRLRMLSTSPAASPCSPVGLRAVLEPRRRRWGARSRRGRDVVRRHGLAALSRIVGASARSRRRSSSRSCSSSRRRFRRDGSEVAADSRARRSSRTAVAADRDPGPAGRSRSDPHPDRRRTRPTTSILVTAIWARRGRPSVPARRVAALGIALVVIGALAPRTGSSVARRAAAPGVVATAFVGAVQLVADAAALAHDRAQEPRATMRCRCLHRIRGLRDRARGSRRRAASASVARAARSAGSRRIRRRRQGFARPARRARLRGRPSFARCPLRRSQSQQFVDAEGSRAACAGLYTMRGGGMLIARAWNVVALRRGPPSAPRCYGTRVTWDRQRGSRSTTNCSAPSSWWSPSAGSGASRSRVAEAGDAERRRLGVEVARRRSTPRARARRVSLRTEARLAERGAQPTANRLQRSRRWTQWTSRAALAHGELPGRARRRGARSGPDDDGRDGGSAVELRDAAQRRHDVAVDAPPT